MSNYKLSIIIPTFNLENNINTTFNSVQSQTIGFENIELIFVDDNSTDNTFGILTEYSNNYDNVNVFKTDENSGFAGKPRNIGLEKSTAEYVLFLDGDDQLLVDSCEILLKNITSNSSDIAIGSHINRYETNVLEHNTALPLGQKEVFESVNDVNLLNITPAISAKLFKKELIVKNSIKFTEGIPGQDLVFLVESILNSKKVTVLNNQYIYYRNIHDNSISYKITEKYLLGLIEAYATLAELFKKHSIDYKVQDVIFKKHLGFFTSQVLRAYHLNNLNVEELNDVMNSDSFNGLAKKPIFAKSEKYDEYFKHMSDGKYGDAKTAMNNLELNIRIDRSYLKVKNENKSLKKDKESLKKNNESLEDENNILKNHNTQLTEQNNDINNKFIELKKELNNAEQKTKELKKSNEYLKNENSNLKTELDEIKSSRLWKLKNRF